MYFRFRRSRKIERGGGGGGAKKELLDHLLGTRSAGCEKGMIGGVGLANEVIIKTRWDRGAHHSISVLRTSASETFSFNPTGHHLSEKFSVRFKAFAERM